MSVRLTFEGLIYLRRSSNRQEASLGTQLDWALAEAKKHGVHVDATQADLKYALSHGLHSYKSLRIDDAITGASLSRPGFLALERDAIRDPKITHVFVYLRDRFARPEDVMAMCIKERTIREANVTFVFSGSVAKPRVQGVPDIADDIAMYMEYYQSGDFLRKLAERVIAVKIPLAKKGYWTGGSPPYGFVRILVNASDIEIEELSHGRKVRQAGCHVRIKPKYLEKITTWVMILDLKHSGLGAKRIANHLNAIGIPSPDAGKTRKDHGVEHLVSGKWGARTVLELCANEAILGMQVFGKRSEGAHLRLGPDGHRALNSDDRHEGKLRLIKNDDSLLIQASNRASPQYDPDKWAEIQAVTQQRGACQRGIPRASDPSKYPLSCRVIDMTDNCGAIMYGRTSGQRRLYTCGRYLRSAGDECENNHVDAEALLKLNLQVLRQSIDRHGERGRLRDLLLERARKEPKAPDQCAEQVNALRKRIASLTQELDTIGERMSKERDDDRYQAIATQFDRTKSEVKTAEQLLADITRSSARRTDPETEVERALALLDQLHKVTEDPAARSELNSVFAALNLRVGLNFAAVLKGKKRTVRRLVGGVIAFGKAELPVKLHGRDRVEDVFFPLDETPEAAELVNGKENTVQEQTDGTDSGTTPETDPPGPLHDRQEGISFTKVNRGDKI